MKAYWISPAPENAVELRETPNRSPKRVRFSCGAAASLNRGELLGGAPGAARSPGRECAGEVVKVGDGVTGMSVGARTMGRCGGGFAELALMDAREACACRSASPGRARPRRSRSSSSTTC